MANAPIGGPPGTAPVNAGYPQWGIKNTTGTTWVTVEAKSAAQKQADINLGYLDWFTSKQAATNQITAQKTPILNGKIPNPLTWALSGTGFAGWFMRGLKIMLGGVLIIVGLGRITGADSALGKIAGKVPIPL